MKPVRHIVVSKALKSGGINTGSKWFELAQPHHDPGGVQHEHGDEPRGEQRRGGGGPRVRLNRRLNRFNRLALLLAVLLRRLAAGSFRTSTRAEIGRARMTIFRVNA